MLIQPIFGPIPTSAVSDALTTDARSESSSLPMLLLLWQVQLLLIQGLHSVNECNMHAPSAACTELQPTPGSSRRIFINRLNNMITRQSKIQGRK
jgi:hypothetical protein